MTKDGKNKDPENDARRKLAEAQAKLESAQEKRNRVYKQTEESLERARLKAESRLAKITQEVEKRAGKVARAEARLYSLRRRKEQKRQAAKEREQAASAGAPPALEEHILDTDETPPTTPQDVADALEILEETAPPATDSGLVLAPDTDPADDTAPDSGDATLVADGDEPSMAGAAEGDLGRYEAQLLSVLKDQFGSSGATFTEWLNASGVSKRTFLRTRRQLTESGRVHREGDGVGARYVAAEAEG